MASETSVKRSLATTLVSSLRASPPFPGSPMTTEPPSPPTACCSSSRSPRVDPCTALFSSTLAPSPPTPAGWPLPPLPPTASARTCTPPPLSERAITSPSVGDPPGPPGRAGFDEDPPDPPAARANTRSEASLSLTASTEAHPTPPACGASVPVGRLSPASPPVATDSSSRSPPSGLAPSRNEKASPPSPGAPIWASPPAPPVARWIRVNVPRVAPWTA